MSKHSKDLALRLSRSLGAAANPANDATSSLLSPIPLSGHLLRPFTAYSYSSSQSPSGTASNSGSDTLLRHSASARPPKAPCSLPWARPLAPPSRRALSQNSIPPAASSSTSLQLPLAAGIATWASAPARPVHTTAAACCCSGRGQGHGTSSEDTSSSRNRRAQDGGNGGGGDAAGGGGGGGGGSLGSINPRVVMAYTCTKCDTRSIKSFSKTSYTKGVVLVRCPGCKNLHLVADHLGWFGEEPFMIHHLAVQQGIHVVQVTASPASEGEEQARQGAPAATASSNGESGTRSSSDPGLAARTAAAARAAAASEGGVFELNSDEQVQAALDDARRHSGR